MALGVHGFAAIVVAGVLYAVIWERRDFIIPDLSAAGLLSGAIVCGVLAYSSLMKAMRTGTVSAVTPFRYTRLLFGLVLGVLAFDANLDAAMVIGSLIIVLSGIAVVKPVGARHCRPTA